MWNKHINIQNTPSAGKMLITAFILAIIVLSVVLLHKGLYYKIRSHQIRTSHAEILNALRPIELDDPKAPELLMRAWALIGEYTEIYLNTYPNASPDDAAENLESLNNPSHPQDSWEDEYVLDGNAIRLAQKVYAVSASYPRVGTFFIVSQDDKGKYHIVWDIKKVAMAHYDGKDERGRWAYLSAVCYGNGPLLGWVYSLPNSINNNPRFFVDATTTGQGGTIPRQLSIWEWDGREAIPLLISVYDYYVDGEPPHEFDGQLLKIHTKGDWKTFFSCGMCPDPQVLWTIRITPDGVKDLGRKDVVPELRMVDELWYRLANGMEADEFASEQVISEIKRMIEYVKHENSEYDKEDMKDDPYIYSLSMLGNWKITEEKNKKILYFTTDNLDCQLRFEIEQRQGKPYFSNLKRESSE